MGNIEAIAQAFLAILLVDSIFEVNEKKEAKCQPLREKAIKTKEQLPDDCTVSDVFERLLFLERILEGEAEAGKRNLLDSKNSPHYAALTACDSGYFLSA